MDAQKLRGEVAAAAFCAAFLFAPAVCAQSTGAVEGIVVNSVTHLGIAGAQVDITAEEGRKTPQSSGTTDASGAFRIAGLAPGKYRAEFQHAGYADPQSDGTAEVNFVVTSTSEPARIRAELMPRSTLRGRLLDREGHAVAGVQVSLLRLRYAGSYQVETDKEGRFAFENVRPTAYVVAAEPPQEGQEPKAPAGLGGERNAWVRTFYPGVPDARQAAPIVIPAGGELGGFEFRMAASPVFRIRGRVVDNAGKPVAKARLRLLPENPLDDIQYSETDKDAAFEFSSVRAGSWRCVAELPQYGNVSMRRDRHAPKAADASAPDAPVSGGAPDAVGVLFDSLEDKGIPLPGGVVVHPNAQPADSKDGQQAGQVDPIIAEYVDRVTLTFSTVAKERGVAAIDVRHQDVDQVEIRLAPSFNIRMSAVLEESPGGDTKPAIGTVTLNPVDRANDSVGVATHGSDSQFERVFAGRYKVSDDAPNPGYYLAAVLLGDRDVLGQEFELAPGSPAMRAVFRSRPGSAKGAVDGSDHATVVLLPRDESLRDLDAIAKVQCNSDGRFEIGSLTPGDYYAWAFERLDVEALRDASFVRTLVTQAASVTVKRGETASVKLSITRWPE